MFGIHEETPKERRNRLQRERRASPEAKAKEAAASRASAAKRKAKAQVSSTVDISELPGETLRVDAVSLPRINGFSMPAIPRVVRALAGSD